MLQRGIMHLSPLSSSKEIDSARSRSGLFFCLLFWPWFRSARSANEAVDFGQHGQADAFEYEFT